MSVENTISDLNKDSPSAAPNMATISANFDRFLEELRPNTYRKGDDLEAFIKECEEYFDMYLQSEFDREIRRKKKVYMTKGMIDRELRQTYSAVDPSITEYQDRLRTAFGRKSTILDDLREVLMFRQTSETLNEFVAKVN